jgi:hypothetical protein
LPLNLPQASGLLPRQAGAGGMTKGRVALASAAVTEGWTEPRVIRDLVSLGGAEAPQQLCRKRAPGAKARHILNRLRPD